jgi:hypothetical protein
MLDFSRFEFLTFDCYGTLINWEEGILRCLHRVLAAHGKDADDATILHSTAISKPAPSRESIAAIAKFFSLSCGSSENNSDSRPRTGSPLAARVPTRMEALAGYRNCAPRTPEPLSLGHHFQRGRRSLRRDAASA